MRTVAAGHGAIEPTAIGLDPARAVEHVAAGLRAGGSPRALADGALRRIGELDGPGPATGTGLGAIITVAPDAPTQADQAEARLRTGTARGPLDGVPVIVKDCIDTAGLRTTHGAVLFADWVPQQDAALVTALRAAGAVVLAKASLDDFAAAVYGISSMRGIIRNPLAPSRTPGGSSGGSAVAVAAGYVPLAIGTDTGGSLRVPAAACGIVAIRPSVGLVPLDGVFGRSLSQDVAGPLASTVRGAAMGLDAMTGTDRYARAAAEAGPGRIGYVRSGLALWGDDPHGPLVGAVDDAVARCVAAGFDVVPIDAPPRELLDESSTIGWESPVAVDRYLSARPDAPVADYAGLVASRAVSPYAAASFGHEVALRSGPLDAEPRYARVLERRAELLAWTEATMARLELDAVAYPAVQQVPAPIGVEQAGVFTRWSEHIGGPAVVVPTRPVDIVDRGERLRVCGSLELLGLPGRDEAVIGLAAAAQVAQSA